MSVKQAAERLGTSRANVYRLVGLGVLPARRLAPRGRLRIRAADLERCIVHTGRQLTDAQPVGGVA